ncbi:MAG: retropepsin-like domain-containing protein [Mycobacteriaceae bacterium]|nr:retropepsin-like domain-containing protein [Mycobacteriaceae bacterium]
MPSPVPVRLLIDTGSSHTILSAAVVAAMGITPTNLLEMYQAGKPPASTEMHDVSIDIFAGLVVFETVHVATCEPFGGPYDGLLGRDILDVCAFTYFGAPKLFCLSH